MDLALMTQFIGFPVEQTAKLQDQCQGESLLFVSGD